ncbi:hypothetical protein ATO12_11855 [Aquimarina atlantica]|uniref:Carrier domain-containing protein n=1 Tax=Aquimarina atlantica TaxID=1317122 RepID=A0A023BWM7_9FLAO|nr:non-ribosomal peptide synthetase [Aquimarina atlantica]EZH74456.1 hypothetical protein ATO12_11855 [Aquimarina atlantica]
MLSKSLLIEKGNVNNQTIIDLFKTHVKTKENKVVYRFLENGEEETDVRTFGQLHSNAMTIASRILTLVSPGERVLLLYPSGLNFTDAFFGCLMAGVIAVPAFPPTGKRRIGRLENIATDCDIKLILTEEKVHAKCKSWFEHEIFSEVLWSVTDEPHVAHKPVELPSVDSEDVAFLQYTSGSTGNPKGVMVSHKNIMHNTELIRQCLNLKKDFIGVSWLPIYHDMGLIGNILEAVAMGIEMIILPPQAFIQKPIRWFQVISKYKANYSGGPNFAFDLCINQIKDDDLDSIDLSSLSTMYNGAEPIRAQTIKDFLVAFEKTGITKEAICPCYGMAETTLAVTFSRLDKETSFLELDINEFEKGKISSGSQQKSSSNEVKVLVGNGPILQDMRIAIVNPNTKRNCSEEEIGEIWVKGPSVAIGYWGKPDLSEEIFQAEILDEKGQPLEENCQYLRTGDMGFMNNNELYVSGRLKEMMIINGVNHYPQDIEKTVQESHTDLQVNAGAAFSIAIGSENKLVIAQEIKRTSLRSYDFDSIRKTITKSILETHDLSVFAIVLLTPGGVSKTTSGKIQRLVIKKAYESNALEKVKETWIVSGSKRGIKKDKSNSIVSENLEDKKTLDPKIINRIMMILGEETEFPLYQIQPNTSFFELGISSIQSIRIAGKISEYFEIDVPSSLLLEYPSIEECADFLSTELENAKNKNQAKDTIVKIKDELIKIPLTYAQESLWLIDQTYGSVDYHLHRAINLSDFPDISCIEEALQILVVRHEAFRSVVKIDENGALYQEVLEDFSFRVTHQILEKHQNLEQEIEANTNIPFDLSSDLKIRVTLFETEKKEYVLLFVLHHIAADGLSEPIFFSEFVSCYTNLLKGQHPNLEKSTVRYIDYAAWQRNPHQEKVLEEKLDYWITQLQGIVQINVPYDFSVVGQHDKKGEKISLVLGKELKNNLLQFSKSEGVTLYMTMLAAFKVLLYKYSGQSDICIGTPIANRTQTEVFNLVGMFVNTLALRSDLGGNPDFREFLLEVKNTTLSAYSHQSVPFEKIVERLSPNRELGKNPLFQIMFDFQDHFDLDGFQLGEITLSEHLIKHTISQFDFTLEVRDIPEALNLSIEYSTSLFKESTVRRLLSHYEELLKSIVNNVSSPIDSLSMLPKQEEELILGRRVTPAGLSFNPGAVDLGNESPINVRFESIVATDPGAVALIHNEKIWSYSDLNSYSNQIAHSLLSLDLSPSSIVGVYMDRSVEFVGCLLGIFKSGHVYTPLDTNNPPSRIGSMLSDNPFSVLITTSSLLSELGDLKDIIVLVIDELPDDSIEDKVVYDSNMIAGKPKDNPENRNLMDSWAYILYTSGSTGAPKGAITRHDGAMNHILAEYAVMDLADGFRFLQSAGIGSDISVWQILGPLLKGGVSVIVDKYELLEYGKLLDTLIRRRVTLIEFVPTYMWGLLSYIKEQEEAVILKDLSSIMLVGESIPVAMVNELKRLYPEVRLWNAYGPCEASDDVIQYEIKDFLEETQVRVPIGRVIPNMNTVILDKSGGLCPIGVIGEIGVSGVGVGAGYLGLPDRTSESFIENPFKDLLGDVLYKTGDLGRWLEDGNIEFIGREDHQVKIRGHRVELEDIASALRKDAYVEDCHVLVHRTGGQDLVICFVVLSSQGLLYASDSSITEVFHLLCKDELPSYMHPSHYHIVDEFPSNLSDKVDGKALLDIFLSDFDDGVSLSQHVYEAPRNEIEEHLVDIWQELLHIDKIGVYDNFFELGGHSLLATQLVSMIRKQLNIEVAIKDIFIHARLSDLAVHISEQTSGVLLPAITPQERSEHIPLSYSQERLWFLDELEGSIAYHMPVVLSLEGALDIDVLEQSFRGIISRHEVLRTMINSEEGVGYQEVISADNWRLEKGIIEDKKYIDETIAAFIKIPFNLSKDYKFRACVYDLGTDGYLLAGVLHHIASDGWSEGVFVNEFKELYSAFYKGNTPILPELPLQYSDYAIWQRNHIKGEVLENELSYWDQKLQGVTPLSLPTDYARPSVQSTEGATIDFQLNEELGNALETLCQQEGVTLFMMLLSAFKVLLHKYSNQEDICVGSPIANRTQSELEGIIGFFVNTLALRTDVSGNPNFKELLHKVKETTLEGYDHQLAPFEKVVDRVVDTRDMSITPLFQVLFVLQNTPEIHGEMLEMQDVSITNYEFGNTTSKFDLTLNVLENQKGILLTMEYCTALFDRTTVEQMLIHYKELLITITKNIEAPIHKLSIITEQERDTLLYTFNNGICEYPKNKTIVDLFTNQAEKTPDAIAVVYEGQKLTYKDLDERSNQLSHYLIQKGVQPEELIGICMDRSLDMITGIFGILKAGGAYVPIDPDYPQNRIDYMIKDSGVNLVVSNSDITPVFEETKGLSIVSLDKEWGVISNNSTHPTNRQLNPNGLAYVIYTSGSTGKPKGVLITNTNVVRLFENESPLYDFNSDDVWTLFHSFCFDFSVWEMYGALFYGGRLVIVPKTVTKDAIAFKKLLIEEGVTVLNQTPGAFYVLQEEILQENQQTSLRYVIFGGEALNPSYLSGWKHTYPNCKLINMYGITETTVHVTYKEIEEVDTLSSTSTIGAAIPTLSCHILDEHLNLVPIGVVGELCIGGAGVARGYLNREELTSERFIPDPFSTEKEARLYKSGDLGRWLPDGTIEYIGRKDAQVKIRGYRMELGEIENVLSVLESVKQCCVLAKEDSAGNKRLVAYVIIEGDFDKLGVQTELGEKLPDYMIPKLWVVLDQMPLTSNGKIDKKSLPEPDANQLSTNEYVAPETTTEKQLATIWKELLGLEKVGIHDNFFEVGGDSIISIRLISKINESFSRQTQLQDLFKHNTIKSFSDAVLLSDQQNDTFELLYKTVEAEITELSHTVQSEIELSDQIEDVYPMSDVQQGMILESLLDPSLAVFHDQMAFPIKDTSFNIDVFQKAITLLIEKHAIFRTGFNFLDYDQPIQIIYKTAPAKVLFEDLSLLDQQAQEKAIENYLESERNIPFEIKAGPLYRFKVLTIDDSNLLFIYQFHHAIMDGWSVASFITELYRTYFELKKDIHYTPAVIGDGQREYVIRELVAKKDADAISFWKEKLSEYKYLDVFSDTKQPTQYYHKHYSVSYLKDLRTLCKKYKVSLKSLFFGAYVYALKMLTHEEELTVGLVGNNRPQIKDGDKTLGCFLNTLPVRYTSQSEHSWLSYFESITTILEEINLYGHLTFFEMKRHLGLQKEDLVFDTLFNFIDFHVYNEIFEKDASPDSLIRDEGDKKGLKVRSFERTNSSLNLTVNLTGGRGVEFSYELHNDFKSGITLEHFHTFIDNILTCFCNKPEEPIDNKTLLSYSEQQKLLQDFNDTQIAYPKDKSVVDLFRKQVAKTPNGIAVVSEKSTLTYKELDDRSNQLANYILSNYTIEKENLIGVMLDRSDQLIISILAILKTGCAYVPIDINYPEERKEYIKKDSECVLIVDEVVLNSFKEDQDKYSENFSTVTIEPGYLAYVIYTSGSTGRPKGVMIEHQNLVHLCFWHKDAYNVTQESKSTLFSSIGFDASVWEIYPYLLFGASLYPISEELRYDLDQLPNFLKDHRITHSYIPTSLCQSFIDQEISLPYTTVLTGGDTLHISKPTDIVLYNNYGPTEGTVVATYHKVTNGHDDQKIPIGVPISNTEVYILNSELDLLPIGVIGELCISGSGLARGYLNREDLTEEKFVAHPFKPGERLYKTGDLARWLADGTIEFIGRKDTQVKIRGYRIELGEIESVLSDLSIVQSCCVLARDDGNGSKRLVGYVVVEGTLEKDELEQELHLRLPDYMVPQLWIELEEMPLTSNGKIDRNGLPSLDVSQLSLQEYVAPRTEIETQLSVIWQDLLGVDKIGVYDNFFELGGHSLLATRLVAMIRKELSVEVAIRDIFSHSTISDLGHHLSDASENTVLPSIIPQDKPEHIPLSFSQERLWFIDKLEGSIAYHIPAVLHLEGDLDIAILEASLRSIVSRHEVLRTVFYAEDGVGYQKVIGSDDWVLHRELVTDTTSIDDKIAAFVEDSFDLSRDYMFRACLYDFGSNHYILAGVFHHIASDGWSESILINELVELYSSIQEKRSSKLPSLSLQYTDYSIWQRKYIEGDILEGQLSYWEDRLKGATPLSLPTDYARPSIQSYEGNSVSLTLDADLNRMLSELCSEEGATLYMVLLSAFKVLLSRYSGQEDICVGTPVANRTQSELEDMIGFFINTLALRSDLEGNPSFKEVLERVKETTLDAYDHQLAPFEKVVDKVIATRDMSMSPLFQVMFVLQNTPKVKDLEFSKTRVSTYEYEETTSQFDLTLTAVEESGGISLNMTYCTALFNKDTVTRMLVHYKELLSSLVKDITLPIQALSMVTNQEREELLYKFNDTVVAYPEDKSIIDLFKQQVKKTPDAIAVIFEKDKLSFKELDERSNQLAHYLISQGIRSEELVGICLDRSLEMIIGILGILKSGAAYVPIDPEYPSERIDYILEDATIKILLSSIDRKTLFEKTHTLEVISLDEDWGAISNESTGDVDKQFNPKCLAYVIYTSGSTGKPKGVMNEHRGVVNRLLWTQSHYNLDPKDAILQKTSFCFDVSVWELFWPIISGAKLVFAKPEGHKDARYLRTLIESHNITTIHFVPSMLRAFLSEINMGDCSCLKRVLCSGEALLVDQALLFRKKFSNVRLDNLYGPTEAAIDVSSWEVPAEGDLSRIPIGKPVANTNLYILDKEDQVLPIGVVGELCIGGIQVARGYLNREELTKEKFVADPFIVEGRMYKTGDLARWLADGTIEYIGRKDDQVKIRGYRIELGEIENVLSTIENIHSCCVLAREDGSGNKRLVGYVVGNLDKEKVQKELYSRLPEYMVPQLWVELEEMPLTSNGKLNKKILPDPDTSLLSSQEYVAPRNNIEKQLVEIWQELLGIDKVGVYDNFFELGGHSLLIVQLISRLHDQNLQIEVKDIFANPTIEALALRLGTVTSHYEVPANGITVGCKKITPDMVPLLDFSQKELDMVVDHIEGGVANIQDMYPLSPLQEGMYFHHLLSDRDSGDPYVLLTGISFDHPDKRSEFIEAFRYVVTRHDVLRTCIVNEGLPNAVQVVLRDVKLKVSELSFSSSQNVKEELELMMASGKHWIDLSKAPLLSLETADDPTTDSYYLMMKYHHTVIDHVGLEKIVGEIQVCLSGDKSSLSTPVLYRDFIGHVLYQQSTNDSEVYFRSRFEGITEPTFPFGLSDTLGDGSGIEESRYVLPRDLSNQLRSLSRSLGMTPAVLFHAAWGLVIGRCSSKDYAIFGSLFSGRLQGSLEAGQSLGLFINTLPVILNLSDNVRDYVAEVKSELESLLPYEQTPLSRIQNWSGVSNDTPLFSALLNYRHSSPASDNPDTDLGMRVLGEKERTNYPFELSVDDLGEDFSLTAFVDGDITPLRVIKYMEMALQELIKGLASKDVIEVNSLSILPKEELQLLNGFNTTEVSYPLDQTVVDLFSAQVSRSPSAVALSYEGLELTYQELDDRSNQLAHYLQEKGVENDELVGICITRSFEMVIGILGILKSGGAYVPIKPDFPLSRISHIVEDTNCDLILTDSLSLSSLDLLDVTKIILDEDTPEYSGYPTASPDITIVPDALSYVIYTSGSTGVPKGAMIEHRGLLNHLLLMIDELEMDSTSVVAFTAPFTFDISVWQLLSALLCGGRVAIYNEDIILDPQFLEKSLSEDEVSILQLVPSYVSELLDVETPKGLDKLNYFLVTGEAVSRGVLSKWFSQYPAIPVVNAYGPAEAADDVTLHKMYEVPDGSMIPIGKPVANMQIHILDAVLNRCPIGVIGEICVSGVGVGRGYINDAMKTASSFISDPFVERGRMYRTGDLGRWLADGTIEFVGRADDQVKIRGYRIELGEIENVLSGIEGITQCCVLVPDDHNGNKRLVGYVVCLGAFDKVLIQDFLSSQLPSYMVPQLWVELEEMPLTGNGKIDKKSLPLLDSSVLSGESYVAPRTDIEEQLALIWQDLLGVDKVGVYDNFFELGGHSLLATRLVSRLRKEMSIEVSIRDVFVHSRLEDLGTHLLSHRSGVILPAVEVQQRPDRIPLSFSQERLWFLDQLEGSAAYHIPIVLRVEGSLDIDILETCFRTIVSRHEVLRTMILSEDGIGYQEVIESNNWKLDKVKDQSDTSLETSLMSYLNIPFDLARDYKFRACLYELDPDRYVLAGVFHHIASDAWSEDLLVKEFTELYEAYQENREVALPELSLQYADYAIWQRNYVEGEILERQLSYWETKLQGVAPLALPTDYVRPSVQDYKGSCITLNLNPDLSSAIKVVCQQEGVTLFMMLLSAFKVLLYKYSGQADICVGTSIANRTQSELEDMIGFFVNTLALRSNLGDNPDFKEFLSQVKDTTLHAYDHQLTPFEKVVDRVVDKRDMSINPLFQVMFDMQNTANETLTLEGITLSPYEHEASTSQFDLNLVAEEKESGILLRLEYFTSLFKESTVRRLLSHYEELLKSIVNNISSPIDALSMLPKQEEELILGRRVTPSGLSFNPGAVDLGNESPINVRFESIVATNPDAVALVHNEEVWNYSDLNSYANQIAHSLLSLDLSSSSIVGVYMDRSVEFVGCLLGIFKSGHVYTPLDTNNPPSRIGSMLSDNPFSVLITTSSLLSELGDLKDIIVLVIDELSDDSIEDKVVYDSNMIVGKPTDNPKNKNSMDSWAYILYTSGSTGAPKGAITRHDGAMNHILAEYAVMDLPDGFRFLQSAGIGSDISVWQILGPLLKGGVSVIVDKYELLEYGKLLDTLIRRRVTLIEFVPTYMWGLLSYIKEQEEAVILKDLSSIMLVGESIPVAMVNELKRLYPEVRLWNAYGPCEASDDVIQYEISDFLEETQVRVPIGRVIPNMNTVILDKSGGLCPIGIIGEIGVSGVGVGAGYLGLPDRTSESFIENPFGDLLGDVLYKTGDLGRWLEDGNIEFIGREDHQVKIRGHRVELEDIASALRKDAYVEDCHVLVHRTGGQDLVICFVVLSSQGLLYASDSSITEVFYLLCKEELPSYMHPSHYHIVDEFPSNLSDKVDGKALLDIFLSDFDDGISLSQHVYEAPRNEIEEHLVEIWQELLHIDKIGVYDNFFELGGHSLLATRLVSMIRKQLNIEVAIKDIFEFNTIDELASHIEFINLDLDEDQNEDTEQYNVTIEI